MSNVDGFQLACRLYKSALPRAGDAHHCDENFRHAAGNYDHDSSRSIGVGFSQ